MASIPANLSVRGIGLRGRSLAVAIDAYMALALGGIILHFSADGAASDAGYLLVSLLPVVALFAGPAIFRPRSVAPWYLLGAGEAAFFVGDVIWFGIDMGSQPAAMASIADGLYIAAYPLMAVGLLAFIHARRPARLLVPLIDAAAVGIAASMLVWVTHVEALFRQPDLPFSDLVIQLAYPMGDMLLLSTAVYLLLVGGLRRPAQAIIVASLAVLLVADILYYGTLVDVGAWGDWNSLPYLVSYALVGLAALLPSMRDLTQPDPTQHDRPLDRMVVVAAAVGVVPIYAILQQSLWGYLDLGEIVISEVILGALLLVRMYVQAARARSEAAEARDQLQLQADILENVRESIIVTDLDGRVTYWNAGAEATFGHSAEDMIGATLDAIYPEARSTAAEDLQQILAGQDYQGEWEGRRVDGSSIWLQSHTTVMRNADGAPIGLLDVSSNVSERRATAERLQRLAAAIEQSSESVMIANAQAEIEYVNPAFERISGYSREEVIGQNPRLLSSGRQPESFYRAMWSTLLSGRPWVADFANRRKDGSIFEEEAVISPIRDSAGQVSGFVAVKRDVTEERRTVARAERQARERALIADTIRGIDRRAPADEIAYAICRQVGSLADIATTGLFVFDLAGRATPLAFIVAGRENVPLRRLPLRRSAFLREQAARGPWIEGWEDRPWHPYNDLLRDLGIRGSAYAPLRDGDSVIGFLRISSTAEAAEDLLADALPALVEFADIAGSLLGHQVAARTEVEARRREIRQVIEDRAFTPAFQPIVDVMRDEIVGYEALTRFRSGIAPDELFAEAAQVGLGEQLELAALKGAIDAAADLPARAWLNVNASPGTIMHAEELPSILAGANREVVVEITEHSEIDDYAAFREAVRRLGPGVQLAVDDAGAGFASLRHILELRPGLVKLDRALITGLDTDQARRALVAGVRHFAQATGIRLIAEGVETPAELAALRELDVRLAQGYLLGRPEPVTSLVLDASRRPAANTNGNGRRGIPVNAASGGSHVHRARRA